MFVRRRQENPFLSLPPSLSPRLAHLFVSVGKERRCPKQDRGGFAQKCLALQNLLIKQRGKKSQHVKTVWWEITTNIGRMSTSIFCALLLLRERAISSLLSVQPERERGNLWACQGRPRSSSSSSSSDPPSPDPKARHRLLLLLLFLPRSSKSSPTTSSKSTERGWKGGGQLGKEV